MDQVKQGGNKRWTKAWVRRLIRRRRPQFGPDQRVQREGHLEGMKRDRTAYYYIGKKMPSG